MKSVSQVTKLTGISARTLQYYDEIDLLKPSELTSSGYRLYNDAALEKLQQILFFKELGFKLQEIKTMMSSPDYDKIRAFTKQKEMLKLKRNRIDRLIQLLERLEKGEQCMSFKEFDLSEYITALETFKQDNSAQIIKYWGSLENFEFFIDKIKAEESEVAKLAIQYFGSVEKYTESMRYNLEHFSEIMEEKLSGEVGEVMKQSDVLYNALTADMSKDVSNPEIQEIVKEIDLLIQRTNPSSTRREYMNALLESYTNDFVVRSNDSRYGVGASEYIVKAVKVFLDNNE